MVRQAFRPGILYGVAPEGKQELTDDEDDEVVLVQDDSQLSDEDVLPAPPPVNVPPGYSGKFGGQQPHAEKHGYPANHSYAGEVMPMQVPRKSSFVSFERVELTFEYEAVSPDPYYFQAMNSHLLYCLQVQQQMQSLLLANSMVGADPLQFMNNSFGMPPQPGPNQIPYNSTPHQYPAPRHPANPNNLRFGNGNKKTRRNWKKAEKSQRQGTFHFDKERKGCGDVGENLQASPLLIEYKSCGKKPSVKDLKGHVVEFSTDSCGSRYIQHMMEICTSVQREAIIDEAIPHAVELMQDMFGNYVMQNLLEHATEMQRLTIVQSMQGIVLLLSTQQHGCRVVQKALDLIPIDIRNALLSELILPNNNISHCARDQHATHVLQKAVELLQKDVYPEMQLQRMNRSASTPVAVSKYPVSLRLLDAVEVAVKSEVMVLAVNPNACRLVQRILGDCNRDRSQHVDVMMAQIEKEYPVLAVDQHGNFILQHILEAGQLKQAAAIQAYVAQRVIELSQHKFGSHLVEKALTTASNAQASVLLNQILNTSKQFEGVLFSQDENHNSTNYAEAGDGSVLLKMMKDPYANFVLQRALDVSFGDQREKLCREITKRTELINQFTYGRHILSHIAKIQSGSS